MSPSSLDNGPLTQTPLQTNKFTCPNYSISLKSCIFLCVFWNDFVSGLSEPKSFFLSHPTLVWQVGRVPYSNILPGFGPLQLWFFDELGGVYHKKHRLGREHVLKCFFLPNKRKQNAFPDAQAPSIRGFSIRIKLLVDFWKWCDPSILFLLSRRENPHLNADLPLLEVESCFVNLWLYPLSQQPLNPIYIMWPQIPFCPLPLQWSSLEFARPKVIYATVEELESARNELKAAPLGPSQWFIFLGWSWFQATLRG